MKLKEYREINILKKIYIFFNIKYNRLRLLLLLLLLLVGLLELGKNFMLDNVQLENFNSLKSGVDNYLRLNMIQIIVFIITICFFIKKVSIDKKYMKFTQIINNSFIHTKEDDIREYENFFFKWDMLDIIQYYETQKLDINCKPSEFINEYNKRLEYGDFNMLKGKDKKINCYIKSYSYHKAIYILNNLILGNESNKYIIEQKRYKTNICKSIILKSNYVKISTVHKLLLFYSKKDYDNIYIILERYFYNNKYELSSILLIFLYISSKKCNKKIDYLSNLQNDKLSELLKEEEYLKFIEIDETI